MVASTRTPLPPAQYRAKLYRSLHDQLEGGFLENAIGSCDRILRLNAEDELATRTKIQILLSLERYAAALALIDSLSGDFSLERAYCCYKTGREGEAKGHAAAALEAEDSRAAQLILAQTHYRLAEYEAARDLYEELLSSTEIDSPKYDDLSTNLASCNAHLEFIEAVPTILSSTTIPSLETLESTPLGPLVNSHASYKSATNALASTSAVPAKKKATPKRLPKKYDANVEPDPDRWLPKRERPGFAEEIVRRREQERGRKKGKEREKLLVQGAVDLPTPTKPGAGGGGGGGKKKKGGKR